VYRIGSITKQFTSLMLLQLIERGKVHFSDPVEKFFPEVNRIAGKYPGAPPITLIQLATPSAEEIRAWDISISPTGKELPPGRGTAKEGAQMFTQKRCAGCHGATGTGGRAPALVKRAPQRARSASSARNGGDAHGA